MPSERISIAEDAISRRSKLGRRPTSSAIAISQSGTSLRRGSGLKRRVIRVSPGVAAVEGGLVGRIERRAAPETLDEIGIGNERFPERDQVRFVGRQHPVGEFEVIAIVRDIGAFEAVAQLVIVERHDVARAASRTFDDVDIDQLQRVEMIDDIVEQRLRVGIGNVVCGRHRRDPDASALGADF